MLVHLLRNVNTARPHGVLFVDAGQAQSKRRLSEVATADSSWVSTDAHQLLNAQNEISEKDHNEVTCAQNICLSWAFFNSNITLFNFTSPKTYISCTSAYLECMVRESKALPTWWSLLLTFTRQSMQHSHQSITRNRVDFISPTNYDSRSLIWTSWKPHCWRNLPTDSNHCWRSPTGRLADAIGEALHARRYWGFTRVMASNG